MLTWASKNIFYPLWDVKDRSIKLKEFKELETTQWLPRDELETRQWIKLKKILHYANNNCKYYKEIFKSINIVPDDINTPNDFLKFPILTKKLVKENLNGLISENYRKSSLCSSKTGGSTGVALNLYFDKQCEEIRNAAAIRSDRWAGWDFGMQKAAIWGNPPINDSIKKKLRNMLLDRVIFLDTMNLNDESMNVFVKKYCRKNAEIIFGHSHSIYIFANFIIKNKISIPTPKGIISSSMMLMMYERKAIEMAFNCQVTNRYGCEEVGLIACECEKHEGMHLNIDHLYIEFEKEDGTVAGPDEEGKIIITDLMNYGMPMIRYRIEDVGIPAGEECSCGRGLPLMKKVAGRVADFLIKTDGSKVAGVSLVERTLTAIDGIEQMQIVQNSINEIKLNVVKSMKYNHDFEDRLKDEFQNIFGKNTKILFNYVSKISQEKSGKYRFSICNIANGHN